MVEPIVSGVYQVSGVVANCYLIVADRELAVVDSGLPYSHRAVLKLIGALGFAPGALRLIALTHADRDHMGGATALRAATGAVVVASAVEGAAMAEARETRRVGLPGPLRSVFETVSRWAFAAVTPVVPDRFVEEGEALEGPFGLRALHTPGHTPGHMSFFASNRGILFAGDSMRSFAGRMRPSSGANTDDELQAQESVWRQMALDPKLILVGHGTPIWVR